MVLEIYFMPSGIQMNDNEEYKEIYETWNRVATLRKDDNREISWDEAIFEKDGKYMQVEYISGGYYGNEGRYTGYPVKRTKTLTTKWEKI